MKDARRGVAPEPGPLEDHLPFLLERASRLLSRDFDEALRANDVEEAEWRILAALSGGRVFAITALGEACMLGQPRVSRLVATLHGRGLLSRAVDDADRRVTSVRLTESGEALARALLKDVRKPGAVLVRHLGASAAAAFRDALHRLGRARGQRR